MTFCIRNLFLLLKRSLLLSVVLTTCGLFAFGCNCSVNCKESVVIEISNSQVFFKAKKVSITFDFGGNKGVYDIDVSQLHFNFSNHSLSTLQDGHALLIWADSEEKVKLTFEWFGPSKFSSETGTLQIRTPGETLLDKDFQPTEKSFVSATRDPVCRAECVSIKSSLSF